MFEAAFWCALNFLISSSANPLCILINVRTISQYSAKKWSINCSIVHVIPKGNICRYILEALLC